MQRIPFYSLADLERSKQEMEAFRKERRTEEKVIVAVKCPKCGRMLTDLRNHPCL